jgi:phospholipid/cholesterol/gamma-HCH transport system ATP-binding protein
LKKSFGDNHVLNGFNMVLHEGKPSYYKSGSGKSVMIKCLIGLEIPDSGSIKVMGEEMENSTDRH